jgi:hypothetical protein
MLAFLERKQAAAHEYSNTPADADQAKARRLPQQMCRVIFNLNEFAYTD